MEPTMAATLKEALRKTLDNLSGADFKRFKHHLRDQERIPWGKLEKTDSDDTVDLMVQVYTMGAGDAMVTILKKMEHNQSAMDLERYLEKLEGQPAGGGGRASVDMAAHSGGTPALSEGRAPLTKKEEVPKKVSLKQKLQANLKNRFSTVYQEFGDCRVQDIYTELYIVEGRTGGVSSDHEVATLDMRQIGNRPNSDDERIKLPNMFSARSATKVLTLGIAGVGKTVAVQKFVMDWVEEKANQDIDFIFVLLFRELNLKRKKGQYSLLDLLLLFHPGLEDLKNFPEFSGCKILLILDGLDESRLKLEFQSEAEESISELGGKSSIDFLITSVIEGVLLPSSLVWVTTRPAAASLIPRKFFNLVTEVRGFNDPQKTEYFKKNIKNSGKADRVINHIKNNKTLHIMCHIPVFCRIIASVLEDILDDGSKEEPPKTLTEVYLSFCVFQISRMNEKYSRNMSQQEKGKLLIKLGKLAFRHLEKGTLIFYEKDLKKCKIAANSGAVEAGVCTQIFRKEEAITGQNTFSFVHLSVQEFLAALYALHEGVRWTNPFLKSQRAKFNWLRTHSRLDLYRFVMDKALQSENGHLDLFVRFLLGLAPMLEPELRSPLDVVLPQLAARQVCITETVQYIKEKIREDISAERTINLFHCLRELGDNSLVTEINSYMSSTDEEKSLTPAQCSALAYLLLMSAEDFEEFDLKKYLRSDEGLRRMLPVVKVSRRVWLNYCNLSKESCKLLTPVLQNAPSHLRELDMSNNDLQDEGVELLCEGLRDSQCKLETLRLNQCRLSTASCELLKCLLQRTPCHLRELDMGGNNLQDEGVELLCVGLRDRQCKLERLRLNQCHVSKASCEMMASVLPSHLRELDMSDNDLQDEGVELLCAGLRDPQCQLEILKLSLCRISQKGCVFLVYAIMSNGSYLKDLDLSYNHPGDSGIRELTDRLNDPSCKLVKLRFDHRGSYRIKSVGRKYACELTLDPDTAHRDLSLSEGNRKVTRAGLGLPPPDHAERFDSYCSQVLCREGLSGRCYWEAEWTGSEVWVAVAYKSIQGKRWGHYSKFGCNVKSWSLYFSDNSFTACHNNNQTAIPVPSSHSSRVGVYLDWPAGTLSFYSVSSDTLTHLHTFRSTFTKPLYPGFYVGIGSSVSLCQIT